MVMQLFPTAIKHPAASRFTCFVTIRAPAGRTCSCLLSWLRSAMLFSPAASAEVLPASSGHEGISAYCVLQDATSLSFIVISSSSREKLLPDTRLLLPVHNIHFITTPAALQRHQSMNNAAVILIDAVGCNTTAR